jgi:hypothetical protein
VVCVRVPENFLFYLSAHESCNERLLARAKGLTVKDIEISPDSEVIQLRRMIYSVRMEVHRMRGFVRLKPLGSHILYGYLKPRHRIGGYIAECFARRTPGTIIVLGNGNESWISLLLDDKIINRHGCGISQSLEEIRSSLSCSALGLQEVDGPNDRSNLPEDGEIIESVWKTYYVSQYCRERKDIRAFHRRMPRKALDAAGSTVETNSNGATLDDFFGGMK